MLLFLSKQLYCSNYIITQADCESPEAIIKKKQTNFCSIILVSRIRLENSKPSSFFGWPKQNQSHPEKVSDLVFLENCTVNVVQLNCT